MAHTPLQGRAEGLEQKLAAVRRVQQTLDTLRETFAMFPELRDDFSAELLLIESGDSGESLSENHSRMGIGANGSSVSGATAYAKGLAKFVNGKNQARIDAFFKYRNNDAATVDEIQKATDIPEPSIRHLFSTRRPDRYVAIQTGGRLKRWRIREPIFSEEKEEALAAAELADIGK